MQLLKRQRLVKQQLRLKRMSTLDATKHITIELEHPAGSMKFDGDLAEGLFQAARHLTGLERLELIQRLQDSHAELEAVGR